MLQSLQNDYSVRRNPRTLRGLGRLVAHLFAMTLPGLPKKEFEMILPNDQRSACHEPATAFSGLLSIRETVMEYWEREVRARVEGASDLRGPALTQALPMLFDDIAMALASNDDISKLSAPHAADSPTSHGAERARHTSFGPEQLVHEYQIFRESIAVAAEGKVEIDARQWTVIDQAINEAMRQALRAFTDIHENARRKVAAALSHDMRTPLAIIANGAQLMSITPSLDMARKAAAKIETNTLRLTDMIGDLLDPLTFQGVAKLALKPTFFDAFDLVKEVRDQYVQGGSWKVTFEAEGQPVSGFWCRDALRRALENLVNNAVKHGDGASIHLSALENAGALTLSVRNAGNPIPEGQLERIFEYARRDKNVSPVLGWGIGLPFVKAVATAHGGDVAVHSCSSGTTFYLHLPLDCRPYAGHPAPP